MENEKFQVNFAEGVQKAELIIREVSKVNELEIQPPNKIGINGNINSVAEFLQKRMPKHLIDLPESPDVVEYDCHIIVNREQIQIQLIFNEKDYYKSGYVCGTLNFHPKFLEFGINTSKFWTPMELGMFFKMNRYFFVDEMDNRQLVTKLMNFTADISSKVERSASENGDKTDSFAQTVNSNVPGAFSLKIPIFKGLPAETIEIEVFANVNGRDISLTLISPAANQTMESIRDETIDKQLVKIKELCPDIVVIEE